MPGLTAQFWGRMWRGVGIAWVPLMIVMLLFAVNIEAAGTPAYFLVSWPPRERTSLTEPLSPDNGHPDNVHPDNVHLDNAVRRMSDNG